MSDRAADSGERNSILGREFVLRLAAYGLQTLGGILLCAMGYFLKEAYRNIEDHNARIVRIETRQDGNDSNVKEIKADIKELGVKIDRMWQAIERRNP